MLPGGGPRLLETPCARGSDYGTVPVVVTTADHAYFRRVADALRRYDRARPPEDLDAVIRATRDLWAVAAALGHRLPDAAAQDAESGSHRRLYERHRALRRV